MVIIEPQGHTPPNVLLESERGPNENQVETFKAQQGPLPTLIKTSFCQGH